MESLDSLTPKEIVAKLDKYIVGQKNGKRSMAVALRNRYRRNLLEDKLRNEIIPKNILMIGPTGVGKTEIARRIAQIINAPFVKVEATKFTEVGYVGRDVESMVRDLVENSIRMVRDEKTEEVRARAEKAATEQLVKLLAPTLKKQNNSASNPFEVLFNTAMGDENSDEDEDEEDIVQEQQASNVKNKRDLIRQKLQNKELEEEIVTIKIDENSSMVDMFPGAGMDQLQGMQDMINQLMPKKKIKKKLPVFKAREVLIREEAKKLIDMDDVTQIAIGRSEQNGIIFIDEIDKIVSKSSGSSGADVSREGVQRDILPIVEGSAVSTKYGVVKTDYILFIAAGAFHISKPSDLIPELQGRFPIRVELEKLSIEDFRRILTEPNNALIKQYQALIGTEGIEIEFTDDSIDLLAEIAYEVNQSTDNVGARRLHTILEKLFEDLSFEAPDITLEKIVITKEYVNDKLEKIVRNRDLSQFIL